MSSTRAELNTLFADGQGINSLTPADVREIIDSVALITDEQGYSRAVAPATFMFTVAPGGALSAGVPATVTLAPVPLGLNGDDVLHRVRITGGSGTAEDVLITGGTAESGGTTGTIQFTPANNHSGAWTVISASDGIQEAINYAYATGNKCVEIEAGTHTVAPINVLDHMLIRGVGWATKLIPRSSTGYVFLMDNSEIDGPYDQTGQAHCIFRDMQISGRTLGTNTAVGFYFRGQSHITIEKVLFDDINHAVFFDKCYFVEVSKCQLLDNTTVFVGSTTSSQSFYNSSAIWLTGIHYKYTVSAEAGVASGRKIFHLQGAIMVRMTDCSVADLNYRGYGISVEWDCQDVTIAGFNCLRGINNIQMLETTVDSLLGHPVSVTVIGGASAGYGARAIYLQKAELVKIIGVDLTGVVAGSGIEVAAVEIVSGCGAVIIHACQFLLILNEYCIKINSGAAGVTVTNNFFQTLTTDADVLVTGNVSGLMITGNTHSPASTGTTFLDNSNTLAEQVIRDNIGIDDVGEQAVTAATTIQFQGPIVKISGTVTITTINAPAYYTDTVIVIPAPGSTWVMTSAGNIANPQVGHPDIAFQMRYVETGGPKWLIIGLAGLVA